MNIDEQAAVNADIYRFAQGYLQKRGWFESLGGIPRNNEGVVPWITYPAYIQLKRIIRPDFKVNSPKRNACRDTASSRNWR